MKQMKTINIFLVFIFLTTALMARMPSMPYYYSAPEFNNLLPFSIEELQNYKALGIKEIEISRAENDKTIYYFNNEGFLYQDITYYKNKEIAFTKYRYNKDGLPVFIESKMVNGKFNHVDTLAYNENGIVIYYNSYEKVNKRNKVKSINTIWHLTLKSSSQNYILLIDTLYSETLKVTSQNQVIKIQDSNGVDSIQTIVNGKDSLLIYWYQNKGDSTFYIGKQSHFTDGLTDTVKTYDKVYKGTKVKDEIIYEYNNKRLLSRVYTQNDYGVKTFYTYYSNGLLKDLPKEIVQLNRLSCQVIRFKYKFY